VPLPLSSALLAVLLLCGPALAADPSNGLSDPSLGPGTMSDPDPDKPRIRSKNADLSSDEGSSSLIAPGTDNIDTPTSAVLDYGGYAAKTRFYSQGGLLQYINFGVFQSLNLGASLTMDGLVGNERVVRLRAPNVQVKYRFFQGDRWIPSAAIGYDGQGYYYNQTDKRYNHRQRGFYLVGSQELGVPGLFAHPSMNISDFDTNSFFGAIPFSYNILDKIELMFEWDNIHNFRDSRINSGVRAFVTPNFHIDFAFRGIGKGGEYPNGDSRRPERIVQLKYSGNF
jgi:hypothetical protein